MIQAIGYSQDARHPEERRRRDVGTQDKEANFLKFSHSYLYSDLFKNNYELRTYKTGSPRHAFGAPRDDGNLGKVWHFFEIQEGEGPLKNIGWRI